MPDDDKVNPQLAYHYQKCYKQLCEGQSNETLAQEAIGGLLKDIKKYGNIPIELLKQASSLIHETMPISNLLREATDWLALYDTVESLSQKSFGRVRGIELATRATKEYLYELQYSEHIVLLSADTIFHDITMKYLYHLYRADFAKKATASCRYYPGVDQEIINTRLAEMYPQVIIRLEKITEQLMNKGNVSTLRLPHTHQAQISTTANLLDADLFQLVSGGK